MPKCCQYAIDDTKISIDLMSIFIKSVNLFCKKNCLDQNKWERITRMAKNLLGN